MFLYLSIRNTDITKKYKQTNKGWEYIHKCYWCINSKDSFNNIIYQSHILDSQQQTMTT